MQTPNTQLANTHVIECAVTIDEDLMTSLFLHRTPLPEPDDDPLPPREPEPEEESAPHPDPVAIALPYPGNEWQPYQTRRLDAAPFERRYS